MITKKPEEKIYLAKMKTYEGYAMTLEVTIGENDIYFVRNENGVNAWHCGSLPKTDHRILEITEKPNA